jgi:hypothetical protein
MVVLLTGLINKEARGFHLFLTSKALQSQRSAQNRRGKGKNNKIQKDLIIVQFKIVF